MCKTPNFIDVPGRPELVPVGCRKCWQCRSRRIAEYVGRCIAEQKYSTQTLAVTLTYAGEGVETATLVYKDFQDFMKRLRKKYSVRYIVAGEYGSKKGRAHWHAILFFRGDAPNIVDPVDRQPWDVVLPRYKDDAEARIDWQPWKAGFSYFQRPDAGGFAYVLKYVLKDEESSIAQNHFSLSKKPPLGHDYFMDLADHYVEQGLAPQVPFYSFSDQFDKRNKRREFYLSGKSRENFILRFQHSWYERYGIRAEPFSEMLRDFDQTIIDESNADYVLDRHYWPSGKPIAGDLPITWQRSYGDFEAQILADGTHLVTNGEYEWLVRENQNWLDAVLFAEQSLSPVYQNPLENEHYERDAPVYTVRKSVRNFVKHPQPLSVHTPMM